MASESASSGETLVEQAGPTEFPRWALAALLVLIAVAAYSNAAFHPFLYDDNILVLKNPAIRSLDNVPEMIGFTEEGFQFRNRWTRSVTHALEYAAVGTWAPLYHMTNIGLHAIVGLLVFSLIGRVSGDRWMGFWTAALFAVHPIQSEVVAHVAGRRGLLAAVFALSAILLFDSFARHGRVWRLGLGALCVYLGVFSKELAIMAPAAFVMIDTFRAVREDGTEHGHSLGEALASHFRRRAALYGFLVALTLCLAVAAIFLTGEATAQGSRGLYDTVGGGLTPLDRAGIVGMAVRLLLVPVGQSVDYSFDALGVATEGGRSVPWLDLGVLALALAAAGWGIVRRNWAGFAALWFALFYLPHLGIIPWHEVFAERFLYLPSIGVFAGVTAAGLVLARQHRRPVAGAAAVALLLLGGATVARNRVWASPLALWGSAVVRYPNCARAHKALGDAYLRDTRADLALGHYKEAVRIFPNYLDARTGIAVAYTGRREFAKAIETLDETLGLWPDDAKSHNALAYVYETLGDLEAAMVAYEKAISSDPTFADGYNNLARLYVERGDLESAVEMYHKALEFNPAMVTALRNLATVYREGYGDTEKADYYESRVDELTLTR